MTDRKRASRRPSKGAAKASSAAERPARKSTPPAAKKKFATAMKATASAAPLLAQSSKKVGKVTEKSATTAPKVHAPYQPHTEPPRAGHNSGTAQAIATPAALPAIANPFAIAAPWMRLGYHMMLTGFEMQTRIARVAMSASFGAMLPRKRG